MSTPEYSDESSTVVITHHIREGMKIPYENWLGEIIPVCESFPGQMNTTVIRPIAGISHTYTVVLRFDSKSNVHNWMNSAERKALIEKVRPLLANDEDFTVKSGLDFWFTPPEVKAKLPNRWKQFLITWSAIFPLVVLVPMALKAIARAIRVEVNHYLMTLCVTGVVVALMVYVVMPHYTKLVHRWLFR